MKCPRCQAPARKADRYCHRCGQPLGPAEGGHAAILHSFHRGDYADALKHLKSTLKRHPDDHELLAWIGHANYLAGREAEAREAYRIALDTQAGLWDASYQLAALDYSKGDLDAAEAGFTAAIAAIPKSIKGHPLEGLFGGDLRKLSGSAWQYLGLAQKELGKRGDATASLRRASELDPENPVPYGVLGDMLMADREFEAASKAYRGALAVVRDASSLLALRNDLGVALFQAGQLEAAADEFKQVIQKDPKNSNAIYNLGVLYLKQGMSEGMTQDLREFLRADDAEHILLGLTRSMVDAARKQEGQPLAPGIIAGSAVMREVLDLAGRAAQSDATVLVLGENGTGKELLARAIHQASPRRDKPFVAVNCGALPEALLESELFGYEKGAFTGAMAAKPGRFELAEGGTLFLDEIGDLKLSLQVKLLRVLQERTYERLGGTRSLKADVRIITATHRDLKALVASGEFREDLFYRLYVVPIFLPPLRDRIEDIPLLVSHFLKLASSRAGKRFARASAGALEKLSLQRWPGNVRELENVVERAVAIYDDVELKGEHLRFDTALAVPSSSATEAGLGLKGAERDVIERQLQAVDYRVAEAAKALGLSRATLYRKIQKYGISVS